MSSGSEKNLVIMNLRIYCENNVRPRVHLLWALISEFHFIKPWKSNTYIRLTVVYSALFFQIILMGTVLGFTGVMLPQMRSAKSDIQINDAQASWIASIVFISGPIGSLLFGVIMDTHGRKTSFQLTVIPLIIGSIGIFLAKSVTHIYISRLLAGLSLSSNTGISSVYICETSPPSHRAFFLSLYAINVSLGLILCTCLIGYTSWRTAAAVIACLEIGCLAYISLVVPESPVWLDQHGREQEAAAVYNWIGVDPATLTVKKTTVDGNRPKVTWRTFVSRPVWLPTLLSFFFFFVQTGSGYMATVFYTSDFAVNLDVPMDPVKVSLWLFAFQIIASVVNSVALQGVKRKTLTAVSGVGMAASLAVAAVYLQLYGSDGTEAAPAPWLTLACFSVYTAFTMFGIAPLPRAFCAEVFPPHVSGVMNGFLRFLLTLMIFVMVKTFPLALSRYGIVPILWFFSGFAVIGSLFGLFVMPETLKKSKEEVLQVFVKKESGADAPP